MERSQKIQELTTCESAKYKHSRWNTVFPEKIRLPQQRKNKKLKQPKDTDMEDCGKSQPYSKVYSQQVLFICAEFPITFLVACSLMSEWLRMNKHLRKVKVRSQKQQT